MPQRRLAPIFALRRATLHYMSTPLSLRLREEIVGDLSVRAKRINMPARTLAQRYVEEGLRMDAHPLIRFVDGPSGRRARLIGPGGDVWEVIAAVRDNAGDIAATADFLRIPRSAVQAAAIYYGAFPEEIDEWISSNEALADEAHGAWVAAQAALRR